MAVPCQPPYLVDDVPIFNTADVSLVEVSRDRESTAGATAFKGGDGLGDVVRRLTLRWGFWWVVDHSNYDRGHCP